MNTTTRFTFYGDLLGIKAAYHASTNDAYQKLDTFYNTVFGHFEPLCTRQCRPIHVLMFSDSVVMWGEDAMEVLDQLQLVYLDLIEKNLLLQGVLVDGALEMDLRIQVSNFRKWLPTNDILARALGLVKAEKGARLLIESRLALKLLAEHQEWLTVEGYIEHLNQNVPMCSPLRRICPSPSGMTYELLYFWRRNPGPAQAATANDLVAERLKDLAVFRDASVARHLRETLSVLKRSEMRRRMTEREWPGV
jgi:hypothetical protein